MLFLFLAHFIEFCADQINDESLKPCCILRSASRRIKYESWLVIISCLGMLSGLGLSVELQVRSALRQGSFSYSCVLFRKALGTSGALCIAGLEKSQVPGCHGTSKFHRGA